MPWSVNPIKHIKDFEVTGGDEDAVKAFTRKLHFKTRAAIANKALFEVVPLESTVLAKSLVDITAMIKEIKKGQLATPKLLIHQPRTSQQAPVKHCGICSCNSHLTDECPELQEDNIVTASHNFYEGQQPSPNNRQYYTQPQGWSDNQQNRWNALQHSQQNQFRPPYTYSQPQNSQNPRYQPPHVCQTYPSTNAPPISYEEALRTF
ncbi:hypothetical protein PIB30_052339 [Stylosanthes scabra]|uniref:Uncharacterized protein n=1 Tax=Stylosanthes scabra TaxID=79078 RepID=A0ABU6ZGX0_9FABA|nr:hypothetical protein [Stylosanthes scabra]